MSENDEDAFIINALMSGAFLVMKKPLTMEAVSHLCQYAIRERMLKLENHRNKILGSKRKVKSQEIGTRKNVNLGSKRKVRGESSKQATSSNYESNLVFHWSDDDSVRTNKAEYQEIGMQENVHLGSKRKVRGESSKQDTSNKYKSNLEYHWSEDDSFHTVKKRTCVDWTPELHAKFMNAVLKLGKGCYPKDILDLMAVPGLTRMQVASHLQKCRAENWKNDENYHKMSRDFTSKRATGKNFGRMPPIQINQDDQEESSKPIGFNLAMNGGHQNEVNQYMTNQTESGSMMPGSNQRNIEQHAGYTPFSFQSSYDSKQHEGFDRTFSETFVDYIQPDAEQGVNHHTFSPYEIPASDDFLDFLKDLDGNGLNDTWIAKKIAQNHNYGIQDEEMSYKRM